MRAQIWWILGAAIYPLWLGSGVLDYLCHRRARIEASTGSAEAALHLAQALQLGAASLLAIFFQANAWALGLIGVAVALHTVTAYIDLRYAASRRPVGVPEQFAHAFLIALPVAAWCLLWLLATASPEEWAATGLALRQPMLPPLPVALALIGGALLAVLPAVLELWRSRRSA